MFGKYAKTPPSSSPHISRLFLVFLSSSSTRTSTLSAICFALTRARINDEYDAGLPGIFGGASIV